MAEEQGRQKDQPSRSTGKEQESRAIREWAKSQGLSVNDRGRVPPEIKAAFEKAKGEG
ncbi:Lsr2 family DNA-binding protein [Streptomyces lasiicapitis]|uniref:Lsr2 family DNA-binding protein n=1 Tax=Streptomyces lasiicapitis TaxID=1923961 RepID=UPI0036954499